MALTKPFAQNGDKKAIPENTTGDGSLSYETGFGGFYALPPEEGGLYIDRAQFNQLMYDTTSAIIENNQSINQINNKFSSLEAGGSSIVTFKQANTTLTLGNGGMFATFDEAWAEAKKYLGTVEIKLVSNIEHNQNITFSSTNAKNININFNGFKLKNTDTSQALLFDFASCIIGNISNLSLEGYILYVLNNSMVYLTRNITINNANYNGGDCIRVWYNAFLGIANNATISLLHPNGNAGIFSIGGSIISIGANSTVTDNSTGGSSCLRVYRGSLINASGVTINSSPTPKANQAANVVSEWGIIFGNYVL